MQPELCVQAAPMSPAPGQAQSVVSFAKTKQASPGAHPVLPAPVGAHGREQAEADDLPHAIGTLQTAPCSPHMASSEQKRRQVMTSQPAALRVKHCEPGAQSLLLVHVPPGATVPAL